MEEENKNEETKAVEVPIGDPGQQPAPEKSGEESTGGNAEESAASGSGSIAPTEEKAAEEKVEEKAADSSSTPGQISEDKTGNVPLKDKLDNGYVPSDVGKDDPRYAKDLADRIKKSGFKKSRIAHADYKKLHYAGLIKDRLDGGGPIFLKNEEGDPEFELEVDASGDAPLGTYYQVSV